MKRVLILLCVLLRVLLFSPACGGRKSEAPRRPSAVLVVEATAGDATLWIDDRPVAQIRDLRRGVRLPPGFHRVEIRHDDYHTRYLELTLHQGEVRRVKAKLARRFD